jgi:hypothetical protein
MNADDDFKEALRPLIDQAVDKLIDQGIPPQPDDEEYIQRFAEALKERVLPEVLKRDDWTRQVIEQWLTMASPAQLREVASKALQKGYTGLAKDFERLALRRKQVEEWVLEEIQTLEIAGADRIGIEEIVRNVLTRHSDETNLTEEEVEPVAARVMEQYLDQL